MELAIKNQSVPIKAIPEKDLNGILLGPFLTWLCGLLTLEGDSSAERLSNALPSIKEHFWSMGFQEIKEMFEMYADSKLSVKPIPNYFDRILVGKIADSYRQIKRQNNTKVEVTEDLVKFNEETWEMLKKRTPELFSEFSNDSIDKRMIPMEDHLVYDFLVFHGHIKKPTDNSPNISKFYKEMYYRAQAILVAKELKNEEKNLESIRNGKDERIGKIMKCNVVHQYFNKLIAKDQHLKDLI